MKKITFLVAALFATMMANATSVTLTMADIAATSGEKDGVSFTTDKKNGSSAPSYNGTSKDLRLYAKNTITITYTENIKSISFAISKKGQYRLASLTADNGTCTVKGTPDFTAVWSGDSKTVTITVGDKADYGTDGNTKAGQLCFDSFTVSTEESGEGGEGPDAGGEATALNVNYGEVTYYAELAAEKGENFSVDFMYYNEKEDSVHAPYVSFDIYSASATAIAGSYSIAAGTIGTEYSYVILTDAELVAESDGVAMTAATLTLTYVAANDAYKAVAAFTAKDGKKYTINAEIPVKVFKALDKDGDGYYDTYESYKLTEGATAIREVEVMTDVYARDGRIYAEEGARIFTVTGLDVTRQNGQLNGIYVVKAGNKVAKVVVK